MTLLLIVNIKMSSKQATLTKLLWNKKCWKTLIALECKSSTVTSNLASARTKREKSNKNNNQIEHPRKWDLKEWSRPTPGTGCLFKKDLISQFTKELSFKNISIGNKEPLARRVAVSLTRRRRIFSRDLFRGGMSLTLYRLCRARLSAGLLGFTSDSQTGGRL